MAEGHDRANISEDAMQKKLKTRIKSVDKALKALGRAAKKLRRMGVSRDVAVHTAAEMLHIPLGHGKH